MAADSLQVQDRWERSETDSGIPYYLNHTDGTTHWEHPNLSFLLSRGFDEINLYKYAAYRTAMKLRQIQKETQLCNVNLRTLEIAFRELGYGRDQTNEVMQVVEVESVLSKIFHNASEEKLGGYNFSLLPHWVSNKVTSQHSKQHSLDPEVYTEITLSWILKCYDSGRTGLVKVHSLKVSLVALCHATIQEKYAFLFNMMSGGQNQIAFPVLKTLLQDLLQLPHNVREEGVFSVDRVADTANSCWNHAGKKIRGECVSREEFWQWVKREPVSLVWFPTLYRLATSESVKHEAKCHECKTFPIIGIRYRCLKCTNVDLCQGCYWRQINTVKNHKMTHPTREYCLATTSGDDIRDFAKQIKNKITRKYRNKPPKKTYLDYHTTVDGDEDDQVTGVSPVFQNAHTRIGHMAERLLELEGGMNRVTGEASVVVVEEPDYEPVRMPDSVEERQRAEEMARVEAEERQRAKEMARVEAEERQRAEETKTRIEVEIRQRVEETTQIEVEARTLAESQVQMTQSQMLELKDKNEKLKSEVDRLAQELQQKPKEVRVPFVLPPPPKASSPVLVDNEIQADMTTSSDTHSPKEWTISFAGDQQELNSISRDLLIAFPTPTTEVFATDLCHELFIAVAVIGNSLDTLVKEVASTQNL